MSVSLKGGPSSFKSVSAVVVLALGIVILIVALIVIALTALVSWIAGWFDKNISMEMYTYLVQVWQPPIGGENCVKCNELRYGCSEYQCHALGQSCNWINDEQESGICVWDNIGDSKPPIISPDKSVLNENYDYFPMEAISPPERGVYIKYLDSDINGCIPAFTNLTLGIYTDEPAICKVDIQRRANYSSMMFPTNHGGIPAYNHSLFLPSSAFPSASALNALNITIEQGSEDNLFYFRCIDTNGKPTTSNFLMEFCVDQGPDLAPPNITGTSFAHEPAYIGHGIESTYFEVYINEPADCRWDFQDLNYEHMNYNMQNCSQNAGDYFKGLDYGCSGNLTGIQSEESTNYYIRCKDQPWLELTEPFSRNKNEQSYILTLLGAPPLVIDEILINDKENGILIKDSTNTIPVEIKIKTSAGAEEGKSKCYYKLEGFPTFEEFFNTDAVESTQMFYLEATAQGKEYSIPVKCEDIAGNAQFSEANFTLEKDITAPEISRVYQENGKMKLITNEPAECVYSLLTDCDQYLFEDGISIESDNGFEHYLDWNDDTNTYVKCVDMYGNQPIANNKYVCSIILRGSEYSS